VDVGRSGSEDGMGDVDEQTNQNYQNNQNNVYDLNQDESNMGDVDYGFNFNNNR